MLSECLGGENICGGKLKEKGIVHWLNQNDEKTTNESGFTGLPGGELNKMGISENSNAFNSINYMCTWWSSTEYSNIYYKADTNRNTSWKFTLYSGNSSASISASQKTMVFSTLCKGLIYVFNPF